jgi:hypothetical protein
VGGVGLREVQVWSGAERVDVRCRLRLFLLKKSGSKDCKNGLDLPRSIRCSRLRLKINDVRCSIEGPANCPATISLLGSFSSFVCLAHR